MLPQYDGLHNTYCGYVASQSWKDIWLWEQFLNEAKPSLVIELGTGWGGFALFLKHQAIHRGFDFHTFDNDTWVGFQDQQPPRDMLDVDFTKADIFDIRTVSLIANLLSDGDPPKVLFCDNGDKPREVRTFNSWLKAGDFLVVHDWGTEIHLKDIPSRFQPVYELFQTDSFTRFFICI